jgi:rod shape determining protein RodA
MVWRIWRAAVLSKDLFGTLLCVGVIAMVVFQVFENVGMTLGIMPVAGIPLPFMSYGGSAVIATFAGIGLALNVRMRRYT